jgi:hypothetical protein
VVVFIVVVKDDVQLRTVLSAHLCCDIDELIDGDDAGVGAQIHNVVGELE